jgi:hypothetical protein
MITLGNRYDLTIDERKESLFRAMHTQPFFNLLNFPVDNAGSRVTDYGSKLDVNKDFFITEIVGNFNEVNAASGFTTEFIASFYAQLNQGSLYKYQQTQRLPVGFICNEARSGAVAFANQEYDDRQFELIPYKVKAGDSLVGTVKEITGTPKSIDINAVLKGYYIFPNKHLGEVTTRGVNESLARNIRFETWKEEIAATAVNNKKTVTFNNDRTARIVLGFGIRALNDQGRFNFEIVDSYRNIKWTNKPIPIEFLAPMTNGIGTGCRDVHMYYLPTEYLLEPFASLQFDLTATATSGDTSDLIMLTRTV